MKRDLPQSLTFRSARRGGFTLVEVLLSLALVVVLLVGVYAALDMYRTMSSTGHAQAERSQIGRGIQQKMAIDIRSVIFTPPKKEAAEETDDQAAEETTDDTGEPAEPEVTDPTEASSSGSKGVIGNATMVVLNISKPPRGLNYSSFFDSNSGNSRTSDLLSVTYLLAGSSDANVAKLIADKTGKTGLARIVGDRFALDDADQQGNEDLLASAGTVIAEEINLLQFRYFDGTDWVDSWDSRASGTLPRAIEVTIGFRRGTGDDQESANQKRFVIALPAADPTPPTALNL